MERKEQLGDEARISKERGQEDSERREAVLDFSLILSEAPGFLGRFISACIGNKSLSLPRITPDLFHSGHRELDGSNSLVFS